MRRPQKHESFRNRLLGAISTAGLLLAVLCCSCSTREIREPRTYAASSAVTVREGTITIPTYPWGPGDLNPHFPWTYGKPIYPYPLLDELSRRKVPRTYRTMILENDFLRVTVLPELGGHVHSVYDKAAGREMFYVNHVIKPGLIGLRGAWISGGIEFNTGPQRHTVTAVSPVSCRFVEFEDGSKGIAIGTTERVFRTRWVVVLRLRPGRRFLEERIRIANVTPYLQPYYFWNCTAVPNTDGMRFLYPMKIGTDHAGTTFYNWPVDHGVDLSWSKNYRKPTGIFAYECNQDFFGSYDFSEDYGIVAYADHYQAPGKKAWTWGRGEDGIRAMATLTDDGSWYNEVQTGPLRTQADYGILEPHHVLCWNEWWYPVHSLQGYVFANRDVAFNVIERGSGAFEIRVIGTGTWSNCILTLSKGRRKAERTIEVSPRSPTVLRFGQQEPGGGPPYTIELKSPEGVLASFTYPLELKTPRIPGGTKEEEEEPRTASRWWVNGVKADKQAKVPEARRCFLEALAADPDWYPAHLSLAVLDLESGLAEAAIPHLKAVLAVDPDNGPAHFWLAQAALELGDTDKVLTHAFQAVRYKATCALGWALAGEAALRLHQWSKAVDRLARAAYEDLQDTAVWNLYAFALAKAGDARRARWASLRALAEDPLDPVATLVLADPAWITSDGRSVPGKKPPERFLAEPQTVLEIAALCASLNMPAAGLSLLKWTSLAPGAKATPITYLYAAVFASRLGLRSESSGYLSRAKKLSPDYVFPHRLETLRILEEVERLDPDDWRPHYYAGCLLLRYYRKEEAVKEWRKALELGGSYSVLYRNLGLVKWKLEGDPGGAIPLYEKALKARPEDLTLYRDLARLYQSVNRWGDALAVLECTLKFKRYRSDVIELLARTYFHEKKYEKAAALLDTYEFHAWEGQHSMHDVYVDVHMELGKLALKRKALERAVSEFKRALDYPENLGVGRPESAKPARQYLWLGKAYQEAGRYKEALEAFRKAASFGSQEARNLLERRTLKTQPR